MTCPPNSMVTDDIQPDQAMTETGSCVQAGRWFWR
jgi:hypothetical protein